MQHRGMHKSHCNMCGFGYCKSTSFVSVEKMRDKKGYGGRQCQLITVNKILSGTNIMKEIVDNKIY